MIDSHQHFWQVGRFDYPWMSSDLGILYRDYLPDDLAPILRVNRVDKTVLVQASNSVAESRWLLDLANANSFIAGVVGWVDLMGPEINTHLDELCADRKFKGVRHLVESEPADDWLVQPAVLAGLKQLSARGLSYDLLVHTRHLKHVPRIAESCPDLAFVIDHLAKPPIARNEINEWSQALQPLARYTNINCKLSGLVTEANWQSWQADHLRPFIDLALEYFGPDRMMFGSDYPVCLLAASYDRVLDSFQEILKDLSDADRDKIFSKNAAKFYRVN
ncbi:MAG TPA: amidohydrolase family protein [Pyrinomonadaceae bacterium]|jgi:L-fuconolactonase|nr:amidohydrolase family protein [Pyrinomonadaceae bacterium]